MTSAAEEEQAISAAGVLMTDFVRESIDELTTAVSHVAVVGDVGEQYAMFQTKTVVDKEIRKWLMHIGLNPDQDNRRLVIALRAAFTEKRIILESHEDLKAFDFFLIHHRLSHLVQDRLTEMFIHYVAEDEFLPVVHLLEDKMGYLSLKPHLVRNHQTTVHESFQRLYDFDLAHEEAAGIEGSGTKDDTKLPLEMRAHLSGFHDDADA